MSQYTAHRSTNTALRQLSGIRCDPACSCYCKLLYTVTTPLWRDLPLLWRLLERCGMANLVLLAGVGGWWVDVGGGTGAMSFAAVEAHPHICATIADLPAMTPITKRSVREAGFSERIQVVTADLVEGALEGSYDAVIMKRFIQVLNPDQARRALANVHRITEPGGTVYILGAVLDDSRLSPTETVASSLNFLNIYDGGQSYTEGEYRDWLTEAGLVDVERVVTSSGSSIVTARKPSQTRG